MAGRVTFPIQFALVLATLAVGGCSSLIHRNETDVLAYTTQPPHDSAVNERARHLNKRGLHAFETGHLIKAEQLFREALDEDVNYGPAHNNLGQVYLARHQLYLAAWEFEYAANLMPDLVEPIINTGLAYETGERLERAADVYQEAYARQPSHPVAIASLVRCKVKLDSDPFEIAFLLDELIMHDGRRDWVEWAKELRATKYRNDCLGCWSEQAARPADGDRHHSEPEFGATDFSVPRGQATEAGMNDDSSILFSESEDENPPLDLELPPIPDDVTQRP